MLELRSCYFRFGFLFGFAPSPMPVAASAAAAFRYATKIRGLQMNRERCPQARCGSLGDGLESSLQLEVRHWDWTATVPRLVLARPGLLKAAASESLRHARLSACTVTVAASGLTDWRRAWYPEAESSESGPKPGLGPLRARAAALQPQTRQAVGPGRGPGPGPLPLARRLARPEPGGPGLARQVLRRPGLRLPVAPSVAACQAESASTTRRKGPPG
jgi:hypothetical protein